MKDYIKHDEWKVIEEGFYPEWNRITESLCSLGNGYMGHRGNFEEKYSGDTLNGSYLAGIYYPDKTRVGWWKNGYPEYFAKVLNSVNWIGIDIKIDGEDLDLAKVEIESFYRELDMQTGTLNRTVIAKVAAGKIKIQSQRFCSINRKEIGAVKYSITALDFSSKININPYLDFDVENEDSNYDEKFWIPIAEEIHNNEGYVTAETKKTAYQVCSGMKYDVFINDKKQPVVHYAHKREKYVSSDCDVNISEGETLTIYKYAVIITSENEEKSALRKTCEEKLTAAYQTGYETLLSEQKSKWKDKWEESDIIVEGDVAGQQGIRFCIFHMNQTYIGEDARLNIGPKGFTGEKYGGSTYWDTEAYCIPFYLATADPKVSRNLLVYRHRHLQKAIENAEKLGFKDGAALYPMVTMTGEECHNEWEITFEEIHRNGAIAYGIYDYIRYTGDKEYLTTHGLEVLIAISRFWSQRVNFSQAKQKYVMLGVTGPNEYENNVNNNWYTNYIASWCMQYTLSAIDFVKNSSPENYTLLSNQIKFKESKETEKWEDIINNMYYPEDKQRGVFLQQDGFLDKELMPMSEIPEGEYPINQNWSWDRILRSCFIKQADVLQGLYFFENDFDEETIKRNFDFYEPMTVHESSLSPCVHAILAAKIGNNEKAYEMYLRTARLDLDDYNNDTEDGLHITSMGGTWLSFVKGLCGMRINDGILEFSPFLPNNWKGYSFKIRFRGSLLKISTSKNEVSIENQSDKSLTIHVYGEPIFINSNSKSAVSMREKANA